MCQDDSCDQVHCGMCGYHTAGNQLKDGLCFDCWMLAEDEYQRWMERRWKELLAQHNEHTNNTTTC